MTVVSRTLKWTNLGIAGLGILAATATLYLWYQTFVRWGDPNAMASAMTWTVVALALFGISAGLEWVRNRGE